MVQIGPEFALSAAAKGAVAAMVLLGVFFGGFIGGYLTDRFGRQRIYKWDLAAISALSIASFFVEGAFSLIIMRLLVGLAVGIDYPIAPALLTEFSPKRLRGPLLGVLISLFFVGGAAAYVTGEIMLSTIGDGAWRWMLASTAVPAAIIAVMRIGTPESPCGWRGMGESRRPTRSWPRCSDPASESMNRRQKRAQAGASSQS